MVVTGEKFWQDRCSFGSNQEVFNLKDPMLKIVEFVGIIKNKFSIKIKDKGKLVFIRDAQL